MIQPTLDHLSNKASWRERVELRDAEDDTLIDITTDIDEITINVRDMTSDTSVLSAKLSDATITVIGTGVFEFFFTADQMGALCNGTYEIGCLVTSDTDVEQLILGRLPVLKGL